MSQGRIIIHDYQSHAQVASGGHFLTRVTATDGVRQNTAARTGVRQRRDVRNQRKVAFSERPLIFVKTNLTDVAWVCSTNTAHRFFTMKVEMP